MAKIGDIYPGEAFCLWSEFSGTRKDMKLWCVNNSSYNIPVYNDLQTYDSEIYFNDPSGNFPRYGVIRSNDVGRYTTLAMLANYNTTIGGVNHRVFRLRRTEERYTAGGSYLGTIPSGYEIASTNGQHGASNKHFIIAQYYRAPGMGWVKVDPNSSYGWVNTGANEYGCGSNWSIDHTLN